jgi:hypothetical protein
VAYLKFSRDKRGYEHFYLVQPSNRGKARPRVLYWFRTPPGVKVGRSPFDPEMRRALEAQNPDVVFDWDAITHTPIPPPVEPERWRERRRVERAFRENEESASIPDAIDQPAESELVTAEPSGGPSGVEIAELKATAEADAVEELPTRPTAPGWQAAQSEPSEQSGHSVHSSQGGTVRQDHQGRRRRRRRGRRKPQAPQVQGSGFTVQGSQVPGSQVQGPEPDSSKSQGPAIQDSGEPQDDNLEP